MGTGRDDNIKMFLISKAKYFEEDKITYIKDSLERMTDEQFIRSISQDYKDPGTMFIISFVVGSLGIDRFMLGDTGMGILKLLTLGLCGVLTIIDWFGIQKKTKEYNLNILLHAQ